MKSKVKGKNELPQDVNIWGSINLEKIIKNKPILRGFPSYIPCSNKSPKVLQHNNKFLRFLKRKELNDNPSKSTVPSHWDCYKLQYTYHREKCSNLNMTMHPIEHSSVPLNLLQTTIRDVAISIWQCIQESTLRPHWDYYKLQYTYHREKRSNLNARYE